MSGERKVTPSTMTKSKFVNALYVNCAFGEHHTTMYEAPCAFCNEKNVKNVPEQVITMQLKN